jgi:hypothetical protein
MQHYSQKIKNNDTGDDEMIQLISVLYFIIIFLIIIIIIIIINRMQGIYKFMFS